MDSNTYGYIYWFLFVVCFFVLLYLTYFLFVRFVNYVYKGNSFKSRSVKPVTRAGVKGFAVVQTFNNNYIKLPTIDVVEKWFAKQQDADSYLKNNPLKKTPKGFLYNRSNPENDSKLVPKKNKRILIALPTVIGILIFALICLYFKIQSKKAEELASATTTAKAMAQAAAATKAKEQAQAQAAKLKAQAQAAATGTATTTGTANKQQQTPAQTLATNGTQKTLASAPVTTTGTANKQQQTPAPAPAQAQAARLKALTQAVTGTKPAGGQGQKKQINGSPQIIQTNPVTKQQSGVSSHIQGANVTNVPVPSV